jgi:hypothetical protein
VIRLHHALSTLKITGEINPGGTLPPFAVLRIGDSWMTFHTVEALQDTIRLLDRLAVDLDTALDKELTA